MRRQLTCHLELPFVDVQSQSPELIGMKILPNEHSEVQSIKYYSDIKMIWLKMLDLI